MSKQLVLANFIEHNKCIVNSAKTLFGIDIFNFIFRPDRLVLMGINCILQVLNMAIYGTNIVLGYYVLWYYS